MQILEMIKVHQKRYLIEAINGDNHAKICYAVDRSVAKYAIQFAVFGNVKFDDIKAAKRVVWVFERLKRLSDGSP